MRKGKFKALAAMVVVAGFLFAADAHGWAAGGCEVCHVASKAITADHSSLNFELVDVVAPLQTPSPPFILSTHGRVVRDDFIVQSLFQPFPGLIRPPPTLEV
jgi:hypothetical protein